MRGSHMALDIFVNGCCQEVDRLTGKTLWARIEMYETDATFQNFVAGVCSITGPSVEDVMDRFVHIPLIDGKNFWELEWV